MRTLLALFTTKSSTNQPVHAGVKYQPGIEPFLVSFLEALRGVVLINGVSRKPLQSNDSFLHEILFARLYEAQLRSPIVPQKVARSP
jgi:hypothetical protein